MDEAIPSVFDDLDIGITLHDPETGAVLGVNDRFETLSGYTTAQLREMAVAEYSADTEFTGQEFQRYVRAAASGESQTVEWQIERADGTVVWIRMQLAATTLAGTDYVIAESREITDRKEREGKLRNQQRAFRRLYQTTASGASFEEKITDLLAFGREYMDVEQAFFTRIDDGRQEIVVGVGPNEQLQAGAAAPFSESYCQYTVDGDGTLTVNHASERGWGDRAAFERFGLACYAGTTVAVDGETYGTLCFADRNPREKEFTDLEKTFVELLAAWSSYELTQRQRERRYRRLTERISSGYYAVDTDWTVTYWNDIMAERQNRPAAAVVGENVWEIYPEIEDTEYGRTLREAMASGERTECEFYDECMEYWTHVQVYPDEDGLAVLSTEITDRKEYEQELERSNERLEQFAYVASHDLQEPLRTISNYIELLAEEYGDDLDDGAKGLIDTVSTSSERLQSMLNGLLDYSRVTTRGEEFQPVDTDTAVADIVADLQFMIEEHDGTVSWDELPTVTADPSQLRQVFQNLVKNALEHADGPVDIEISATETDDHYRFVVADDGPGIDEHRQTKIFRIFNSSERDQTSGQARGIGLAICENIVRRHDGEIHVESEPGEGSRFVFTIAKQPDI